MRDIINMLNSSLFLSMKIDNEESSVVTIVIDRPEDFKDVSFEYLVQFFYKKRSLKKITFDSKEGNKSVKLLLDKRKISKKDISKVNCNSIHTLYNEELNNMLFFMIYLLVSLKVNCKAETNIDSMLTNLSIEGRDNRILNGSSIRDSVYELVKDKSICKKYINHVACQNEEIKSLDDIEAASLEFSEGRESLQILLEFFFKNNIRTVACCAGHDGKPAFGYIAFDLRDENTKRFYEELFLDFYGSSNYGFGYNEKLGYPIPGYLDCYFHLGNIIFTSLSADKLLDEILKYAYDYCNKLESGNINRI